MVKYSGLIIFMITMLLEYEMITGAVERRVSPPPSG